MVDKNCFIAKCSWHFINKKLKADEPVKLDDERDSFATK